MEEREQIIISVHQGQHEHIGGVVQRVGTRVTIKRPGRGSRTYSNPSLDSFVALTDLIRRHGLIIWPWSTHLGYTCYWTPGQQVEEEVESGDES